MMYLNSDRWFSSCHGEVLLLPKKNEEKEDPWLLDLRKGAPKVEHSK